MRNFILCMVLFVSAIFFDDAHCQIGDLPRSTPEAEGVSSKAVLNFVESLSAIKEIHGFMILRHGKVISEGWWNPFEPKLKHTLYSVSKTFTATAAGFATVDGLLSVDDRVITFFPEYLPETISPNLSKMTIKHLLGMSTGQEFEPTNAIRKENGEWIESFFAVPVIHEPGTVFMYNSMASFMLSAIVQKVTGMKISDYLKIKLFEPLNIIDADWEENPAGINVGGWGLRVQTESMAKFGQFFLQKGRWNDKQIISEAWINEATTATVSNKNNGDNPDREQGYCYQMWRCRHNAVRMDGAFGQFVVIMPDQDMVVVMTANVGDMADQLNKVWDNILPGVSADVLPADPESLRKLDAKIASLSIPAPEQTKKDAAISARINKKTYRFENNNRNIESVSFNFDNDECIADFRIGNRYYAIPFSKNKWHTGDTGRPPTSLIPSPAAFNGYMFRTAGAYSWKDDTTLELVLRYIDGIHTDVITCRFGSSEVTMEFDENVNPDNYVKTVTGKIEYRKD